MSDLPPSSESGEWNETGLVLIDKGVTYVEGAAVVRWLKRADQPELARKFEANIDHMVRTGIEKVSAS